MHFVKESWIKASPERVFAFHESPGAFQRLTPPWESIEVVEGGQSIKPGSQVVLRARFGPFRMRWVAEHREYEPGRMFSDTQKSGPFARWYHRHWFLDDAAGGTLLRDEVDYELPLGMLGRWLAGGYLKAKLERLFAYRHEVTKQFVEAGGTPG